MPNLTQIELQNLRHLIGAHGTIANKLDDFAKQCTDPAICNMLQQDANAARTSKDKLITFLK